MTTSPTVIVLNGPSVAGKSSIQHALQKNPLHFFMAMGIDSILVKMLPQRYFTGAAQDKKEVLWGEFAEDPEGRPLFHLHFGPRGRNVIRGMHNAIAGFAKEGNSIVVDYIRYESEWTIHMALAFERIDAYLVAVDISLETLEEREKARATSPAGHARSHYDQVHRGLPYDLRVNTETHTPEEIAAAILSHVQGNAPTAFQAIRDGQSIL